MRRANTGLDGPQLHQPRLPLQTACDPARHCNLTVQNHAGFAAAPVVSGGVMLVSKFCDDLSTTRQFTQPWVMALTIVHTL